MQWTKAKLRRIVSISTFLYVLHRTVPDERHLHGRIESGSIRLDKLISEKKYSSGDVPYKVSSIRFFPYGTSAKTFGICSKARLRIGSEDLAFFGILGTWFKI